MAESTEDRILKFIRVRGDEGATAEEIAGEFLQAKGARGKIANVVIGAMLGGDGRFARGADGRWRAPLPAATAGATAGADAPAAAARCTIVEFTILPLPDGDLPIEAAALRVPPGEGRNEAQTPIQPARRLPPATKLPPGLGYDALAAAPHLAKVLEGLGKFARGSTVVSFERTPFHVRVCRGDPRGRECEHLSLEALARRLRLISANASLKECAEALGVFCPENPRAADAVRVDAEYLAALRERIDERKAPEASDLVKLQQPVFERTDFSRYAFDGGFLQTLPEGPGVYVMVDAQRAPLYVGKAKNLRERVGSYFRRRVQRDGKTSEILERVYDIGIEVVGSELEALLLEHERIQELAPPINRQYDIHERHPSRERPGDVILILPSAAAGCAELFMVRLGLYLIQLRVARDDPEATAEAVREIYFSGDPALDETDRRPDALEILWSWLEQRKDEVNRINVGAVGDPAEVLRLLAAYLQEDTGAGRTYHV